MAHKILVVDDDNALREMVGIVLESEASTLAITMQLSALERSNLQSQTLFF